MEADPPIPPSADTPLETAHETRRHHPSEVRRQVFPDRLRIRSFAGALPVPHSPCPFTRGCPSRRVRHGRTSPAHSLGFAFLPSPGPAGRSYRLPDLQLVRTCPVGGDPPDRPDRPSPHTDPSPRVFRNLFPGWGLFRDSFVRRSARPPRAPRIRAQRKTPTRSPRGGRFAWSFLSCRDTRA